MKTFHIFMIVALAFASCEAKCASFGKIIGAIKVLEISHKIGTSAGCGAVIVGGALGMYEGLKITREMFPGPIARTIIAPWYMVIVGGFGGILTGGSIYISTSTTTAITLSTLKSAHWVITKIVKK